MMRNHVYALIIFAVVLCADFITKHFVDLNFLEGERIKFLGGFFQIIKIYNRGGIFGIAQGYQFIFLMLSIVVFFVLLAFYIIETVHNRLSNSLFSLSMGLVFSGAIGNILDRALGKPGVVDFIYIGFEDFFMWPAFNIADMAIVTGALGLTVFFMISGQNNFQ